MEKKWYKVTFYAPMTPEDVKAMDGSLYAVMEESMDIYGCEGLDIKEDVTQQRLDPDDYEEYEDEDIMEIRDEDWEYNDADGTIAIYKKVFDGYEKGKHVNICCVDEENKPIYEYAMVGEDDKKIYYEFIG